MTTRRNVPAWLAGLASFLMIRPASAQAPDCRAYAGRWGAMLGEGSGALRLVLEIDADGVPVLVSVDQGAARIPATGGTCSAGSIQLAFRSVRGQLEVEGAPDGPALTGSWSQGQAIPVQFTRLAGADALPVRPIVQRGPIATEVPAALARATASALAAGFWTPGASTPTLAVAGTRLPQGTAAQRDDLWHIGSITKSMTGTLLARLVAAGQLDWSMPLSEGLKSTDIRPHPSLAAVTLHQLVTGRSGIATNVPVVDFVLMQAANEEGRKARPGYVRTAVQRAPEAEPGTGFIYPNSGFVIAGLIAELATGQSWEELMQREVFGPLGLTSAGFGPPDPAHGPSGMARSAFNPKPVPVRGYADNPKVLGPAGTVHTSLSDLLRFGQAHGRGARGEGDSAFLSQQAWRHLHTPPPGASYAIGWETKPEGVIWHNGSNTMWHAELQVSTRNGRVAAAAANSGEDTGPVGAVLEAAWQQTDQA